MIKTLFRSDSFCGFAFFASYISVIKAAIFIKTWPSFAGNPGGKDGTKKQPNLGHFSDNKMKYQINYPAYFTGMKTELDIAVTANQRAHEYESVINYACNPIK